MAAAPVPVEGALSPLELVGRRGVLSVAMVLDVAGRWPRHRRHAEGASRVDAAGAGASLRCCRRRARPVREVGESVDCTSVLVLGTVGESKQISVGFVFESFFLIDVTTDTCYMHQLL